MPAPLGRASTPPSPRLDVACWQRPSASQAPCPVPLPPDAKVPRQPDAPGMHGVLVVAKPAGPTSHDVVALLRRLAATRRIGHGGGPGPVSTGGPPALPCGATRVVQPHLPAGQACRDTVYLRA